GGFRCKIEYPWCIIKVKSKHLQQFSKKSRKTKKKTENRNFYAKPVFDRINFFLWL
ncbi:Uncharacterized protein FWK35_00038889, partial [Aphis craccivora]